jgi:hypothetical protein
MRIGNVTPRLNGIVSLGSLGNLGTAPDLLGQVTMYFNSFMASLQTNLEHGMASTPDVVAETLYQAVKDSCAAANSMISSTGGCDPNSVSPQIASMVQQYTDAYNKASAALAQNVQAGLISVPSSYIPPAPVVSPSQVQYSSQPPNALDRVTPQTSMVITPQVINALAPPQTPVPMTSINAGTFTGTQATGTPAGQTQTDTTPSGQTQTDTTSSTSFFDQAVNLGGMSIPTWVLLAGAGFGLFLMTKGKK